MNQMSQYRDYHTGRPAAVLGGGPSLPEDLKRLPSGCVLIAVNFHAFYYCRPDYMVYNDHPESTPELAKAVQDCHATLVSPDPTSDIAFDIPVWTGFYSSNTAAWFALWCGCDPVILCGCDCYQSDVKYCHPYNHDQPNFHYGVDHHLRPWIEEGRVMLPHVERLKAMSGPLVNVFGQYEAQQ